MSVTAPPTAAPNTENVAASEIEAKMRIEVRDIGIPPRPSILDKINAEMRKDEPDFKHLADIVGSDVGLAASVIKVANSPFFGFNKRVRSVPEALMVLGLKVIVRTIAGLALKDTFPHVPSLERFWDASACTARVSGWLAQRIGGRGRVRAEDAYTFGLFRECGIPVLMIPFPEYQGILAEANRETALGFTDIEDRALAINHAIVGSELAEDWLLPEEIHLAIRHHHDLAAIRGERGGAVPDTCRRLIAVAQVAEHLIFRHTGLNRTSEWDKLGAACLEVLGLAEEDLEALFADSQDAVKSDAG